MGLTAWFGVPRATESFHNWRETVAEQSAQSKAEQAIQDKKDAAQAKADKLAREERVRSFDSAHALSDDISSAGADEWIAAQPTDEYVDLNVPSYNATNINTDLAHDVAAGPRAFEFKQFNDSDSAKVTTVRMPIGAHDTFRVAHNGSKEDIILTYFDPKTNTLTIRDVGPSGDGHSTTATEIYIQRIGK